MLVVPAATRGLTLQRQPAHSSSTSSLLLTPAHSSSLLLTPPHSSSLLLTPHSSSLLPAEAPASVAHIRLQCFAGALQPPLHTVAGARLCVEERRRGYARPLPHQVDRPLPRPVGPYTAAAGRAVLLPCSCRAPAVLYPADRKRTAYAATGRIGRCTLDVGWSREAVVAAGVNGGGVGVGGKPLPEGTRDIPGFPLLASPPHAAQGNV